MTNFSALFGVTIYGLYGELALRVSLMQFGYRLGTSGTFTNFPEFSAQCCEVNEADPDCDTLFYGQDALPSLPTGAYTFQYTFQLMNIGNACIIESITIPSLQITKNLAPNTPLASDSVSDTIIGNTQTVTNIVYGANTLPDVTLNISLV